MSSALRWSWMGVAAAVILVLPDGAAWAGVPTDQLRGRIERVLKVLDPETKRDGSSEERRAVIRKIADETFDFREMSQRSLARHWQSRTPAERDEFTRLFADVLERAYFGQIEQYSGGEKVLYVGETVEGDQAQVRTKLITKQGTEIPVEYRMHRVGDRWLVYDVTIEGVSLVANYRAQFDRVIRSSSYQQLTEKLKARKDEADADAGKRASSTPK